MTARLDNAAVGRLAKILGLLGSDHVGERAAAGAKAHALLRDCGLTWRDVLYAPPIVPVLEGADSSDWKRMVAECRAHETQLSPRERKFVLALVGWRSEPSEKQLIWLGAIHARLHSEKAANR